MILRSALVLTLLTLAAPSDAEVYKCEIGGRVTYQQSPCPGTGPKVGDTLNQGRPVQRQNWYEGGTLHEALMDEWSRASAQNKLATAADWVVKTNELNAASISLPQTNKALFVLMLQRYSQELVSCLDQTNAAGDADRQKASEIAVFCMLAMYPP